MATQQQAYEADNDYAAWLAERYEWLIDQIPQFEILSAEVLPYGLRQHTRSICWLAEQVIIQNTMKHSAELGVDGVVEPNSDLTVWDFRARRAGHQEDLYINIKVTDASKPRRRNDMSSLKRLLRFFDDAPDAHLLYLIFPFNFIGNSIRFRKPVLAGYYSKMSDFVLNIRNQHLQAYYDVAQADRSNGDFVDLLRDMAEARGIRV